MIKLPEKNWFTFSELIQRWQCTEFDIVHMLFEGQLVASYHFTGEFDAYEVKSEADGVGNHVYLDDICVGLKGGMVDQLQEFNHGFRYLMQPKAVSRAEGEFHFFSGLRNCLNVGDRCFRIPTLLTLSEVIRSGVVMAVEVALFEVTYGKNNHGEKPLSKRERDTLLIIIGVLCKELKLNSATHAKTAGLIENMADMMGVSIGETTIEGHLKKISDALATHMK